jgi:hypothetical protein
VCRSFVGRCLLDGLIQLIKEKVLPNRSMTEAAQSFSSPHLT